MSTLSDDGAAVVAAILAAVKLIQQSGPPQGAKTEKAYVSEYLKMLDRVKNPHGGD